MKLYVVCDLEGCAGVVDHRQQCQWDSAQSWYGRYLDQARRLATHELNAFVEGALDGGAKEIIAWEGHGSFPGCIDIELLHPACKLIMGAADRGPIGLDDSFDAMCQVGMHAMQDTRGAVLPHGRWRLNGQPIGEIGMNCLQAGYYGFPCVFLSGDRAAAEEIRALVPDVETVVVKEGIALDYAEWSPSPALSLSPQKAREVICDGARKAMGKIKSMQPYRIEPPYALEWTFPSEEAAEEFAASGKAAFRTGPTTVETRGDDLVKLL